MKFFIVLLAVVAACTARQVSIDESGNIHIIGENGKQIYISRPQGEHGQRVIEIAGHGGSPAKRIEITDSDRLTDQEERNAEQTEQSRPVRGTKQQDVLGEIFSQYKGRLDSVTYQKLLTQVEAAVKKGTVPQAVYEHLRSLEQQYSVGERGQVVKSLLDRYYNRPESYNSPLSLQQFYSRYFGRYSNVNGQEQTSYEQIVGLDSNGRQLVSVDNNGRRAVFLRTPEGIEVYYPETNERYYFNREGQQYYRGERYYGQERVGDYSGSERYYGQGEQLYGGKRYSGVVDDKYRRVFGQDQGEKYYGQYRGQYYGQDRPYGLEDRYYGQYENRFYGPYERQSYGPYERQYYGQQGPFYGQYQRQSYVPSQQGYSRYYPSYYNSLYSGRYSGYGDYSSVPRRQVSQEYVY